MPERPTGPFELRIPPLPEHVATARLFIASLARVVGLDEAVTEDLRLAISEAVTASITGGATTPVVLSGELTITHLTVRVGPLERDAQSDDRFDVASIIGALFDSVGFEQDSIVIPVPISS